MGRIRIAMIAVDLGRTGISTVILNYCQHMDLSKFDIDLIVGNRVVPEYRDICNRLGIDIVEIPFKHEDAKGSYIGLYRALKNKRYDIAHIHGNSAMITPELFITFLAGIKVRIVHCHNSTCDHMRVDKLLRPFFRLMYTDGFACSTLAGKWLFEDQKFYVIPNGFDTNKFLYSPVDRDAVRAELGINNSFVIGHIGQFNDQKNHRFLLEVFEKIGASNKNAVLLLIGGGPDKDAICSIIKQHPFSDRIIVYGETDTPEKLYNAMDVFVFPSKYEGLGIVLLEAQINGLFCVSSDVVPPEAIITDNVRVLALTDSKEMWAEEIQHAKIINRLDVYSDNTDMIDQYDICKNTKRLESIYYESVKQ